MTKLALCDGLTNLVVAASYAGLENYDEDNPPGHLHEESLRIVLLTENVSGETRHLHMIPSWILFGVAT